MRILLNIVALLVVAVLSAGGAILIAVNTPDGRDLGWVAGAAVSGYLLAPLLLASLSSFWEVGRSADARRGERRLLLVMVGVQVLATVAMCVFTVATGAAWWLTPLFLVVGVAAMAAAVALVPFLRRVDRARPADTSPPGYGRAEFRRDLRRILVTTVATLVGGAVVMGGLLALLAPDELSLVLRYAPLLAVMGGGIACVLVSGRLGRRIRDLVGGDMGRADRIGKVVVRNKDISLSPEDEELVAPFARLSWVSQVYQLAWVILFFVATAALQLFRFADDPTDPWPMWFVVAFGAALIAVIPVTVIQVRRTRSFAVAAEDRAPR